jgi:hypothetical protein
MYCPNRLERYGRYFLESQGANESAMNAQEGMTHRKHRGKMTDQITDRNRDPAG